MKVLIGAIVAFLIGAGCRYFDVPVPSPPVLPGALLVVAMTLGFSAADRALTRRAHIATTKHLCGGPSGTGVAATQDVRCETSEEECLAAMRFQLKAKS
ncbi:MAG: XapX domain-containing protein [Bryobacteraceae bacterium]|jgi:XapX domain-containing protein